MSSAESVYAPRRRSGEHTSTSFAIVPALNLRSRRRRPAVGADSHTFSPSLHGKHLREEGPQSHVAQVPGVFVGAGSGFASLSFALPAAPEGPPLGERPAGAKPKGPLLARAWRRLRGGKRAAGGGGSDVRAGRRPRPRHAGLASLSSSVSAVSQDKRLRETFRQIDASGSGAVSEADLATYARRNGLPSTYVPIFMKVMLGNGAAADSAAASRSDSSAKSPSRPAGPAPQAAANTIDVHQFTEFVKSRETALRVAFDRFDRDADGKIGFEDLEASMSHIIVTCPKSRCVYKCPKQTVHTMLASIGRGRAQPVSFQDFRRYFLMLPTDAMLVGYWYSGACPGRCQISQALSTHDMSKPTSRASPWGHLFAGAVAGAASRSATAPLETLRLAAMTGALGGNQSLLEMAQGIVRRHGWQGLYKGNGINVMRSAPQKALDFFAFDAFKNALGVKPAGGGRGMGQPSPVGTLAAAGLAGAVSNTVLYPLEVLRCRLSVDASGAYAGMGDAFRKIIAKEGLPSLYKGVVPSVAAILPEAAITYGLFDILKSAFVGVTGREAGVTESLAAGVCAAFAGQLVAYPLETVARRMQISASSITIKEALAAVLADGGVPALYRGLGAASFRVVPMAMVSFGTYEAARAWVMSLDERRNRQSALLEYAKLHPECAC